MSGEPRVRVRFKEDPEDRNVTEEVWAGARPDGAGGANNRIPAAGYGARRTSAAGGVSEVTVEAGGSRRVTSRPVAPALSMCTLSPAGLRP